MRENRSMPPYGVIPVLAYADVNAAADWLCAAFGFTLRLRIGDHRAQLNAGEGAVVLGPLPNTPHEAALQYTSGAHSVMVRVDDVDALYERAVKHDATVVAAPATYPFGERQCTVGDFAAHHWTFSQTVEDVAPEDWGGERGQF